MPCMLRLLSTETGQKQAVYCDIAILDRNQPILKRIIELAYCAISNLYLRTI